MRLTTWIVAAYGVLLILGGLFGYASKQSLMSLVSGSAFGVVLLLTAFAMHRDTYRAHYLALLLAMLFTLFFQLRYMWTANFFPNAIMALISCLVSVALLILRPTHRS